MAPDFELKETDTGRLDRSAAEAGNLVGGSFQRLG